MSAKAFADTNILIYATLQDAEPAKAVMALETLWRTDAISVQVLNEFVNVARRKLRRSWDDVEAALAAVGETGLEIGPLRRETHDLARQLSRRHDLTIYDACIVAAALEAGCDTLWSEDMQHGRRFGDLTVRNPFAPG